MLKISNNVFISVSDLELTAIRAQGAGGQNVNKVSTAIHLRFKIKQSSLPELYKLKLLDLSDNRISREGTIIIKAHRYKSQEKNREDAIQRLVKLIKKTIFVHKKRTTTKPPKSSVKKRLESKTHRSNLKKLRDKGSLNE